MMNNWKKAMLGAALLTAAFTLAGCGGSGDKPAAGGKVQLKMATALPASHPLVKEMESLKQKVADKTNGTVEITIYPAGQLFNDKNMNDAVMSGGVDMGLNSTGRWASVVPTMDVFNLPFLFPTYEAEGKAIDSGLGDKLGGELLKKGVRPLVWVDYGTVHFANNVKEVKTPADMAGLKMRGYDKYSSETLKALGASPVTMGAGEVYVAVQRGTIDGQISGTTAMRDRKMYEVTKYLTFCNLAAPEMLVTINEKSYNKLSDDQKKALTEASKEVQESIRANSKKEDLKALDDLKKLGMQVYEVPKEDLAQWRDATKSVLDLFVKANGKLGQEMLDVCLKQQ